jgi:hypothetical protein
VAVVSAGSGTREDPWQLKTPPGKAGYEMWRDEEADPPALVCQVGGTQLRYHLRAIDDLHAMLKAHGDWLPLGGADEQKPAPEGSVEAWGRSPDNPVGGWYGLKKGLRGRFGVYLPPLLEALGLADLTPSSRIWFRYAESDSSSPESDSPQANQIHEFQLRATHLTGLHRGHRRSRDDHARRRRGLDASHDHPG